MTPKPATRALAAVAAVAAIAGSVVLGVQRPIAPVAVPMVTYPVGVLPDTVKTPGVANPAVTADTIGKTIAVPGWTATVRPPVSYTDRLKLQQLRDGYAVPGHTDPHEYEEDHLEAIETGGNPTDPRNIWPSLWHNRCGDFDLGMKTKDVLETRLKALVVARKITLEQAQDALAHDWPAHYRQYVGEWPKWKGNE